MSVHLKWLLWADAIVLVLLIVFVSNLALVLPVRPAAEFWGLAWPPFIGDADIKIPDRVVYASFIALLIAASTLVAYALTVAGRMLKGLFLRRKLKAPE